MLAPWAMAAAARIQDAPGPRRRDHVDRRRVRRAVPGDGRAAGREPAAAARRTRSRRSSCASWARRRCSRRSSASARRARCCCRGAAPGQRTPLWQQRKRRYDLLQVASRFGSFPMLLEAYRECLRDLLRHAGARRRCCAAIAQRTLRVVTVDTTTPSPFAASLLFGYVANYLYDGDAPLAERRAQALTIDQEQLRELLGEAELRELLDADVVDEVERELQLLDGRGAKSPDSLHDLLLRLGDLSAAGTGRRAARTAAARAWADAARGGPARGRGCRSRASRGSSPSRMPRATATRLGIPLPPGLPEALLGAGRRCRSANLASRFARTHAPFTAEVARLAVRAGDDHGRAHAATGWSPPDACSKASSARAASHREWCDAGVLGDHPPALAGEAAPARSSPSSRTCSAGSSRRGTASSQPRRGTRRAARRGRAPAGRAARRVAARARDPAGARRRAIAPRTSTRSIAAGEVVWVGVEPLGDRDGRDRRVPRRPPAATAGARVAATTDLDGRERAILDELRRVRRVVLRAAARRGRRRLPAGHRRRAVDPRLAWARHQRLAARAARVRATGRRRAAAGDATGRPRRSARDGRAPPSGQGRWSLVAARARPRRTPTEHRTALAQQLLTRHGIVTREVAAAEGVPGGFAGLYDIYKRMEERGRVRRGYFTLGVGAMQFAHAGGARPAAVAARGSGRGRGGASSPRPIPPTRTAAS